MYSGLSPALMLDLAAAQREDLHRLARERSQTAHARRDRKRAAAAEKRR